jgi:3-methyladenine DNA glycosylase AlkC
MIERRKVKHLLGAAAIGDLASKIAQVTNKFSEDQFVSLAQGGLETLSLMARAEHIADALRSSLRLPVTECLSVLVDVLGAPRSEPGYGPDQNFRVLPLTRFVGRFGLNYFDASMTALYEMTRRFTAEFDIRPFLIHHRERTLQRLNEWALDSDMHVRRLVSEGTRPRLPWAPHLACFRKEPAPVLQLLELLKDDQSSYVRRSVANNLADVFKDNPEAVLRTLQQWSVDATPWRQWTVRHALRAPCSRGDSRALNLLGLTGRPNVEIKGPFLQSRTIRLGSDLSFQLSIHSRSRRSQPIVLAYTFVQPGSKRMKPFSLQAGQLRSNEGWRIDRTHAFIPRVTRKYRPGEYELQILLNGTARAKQNFLVTE